MSDNLKFGKCWSCGKALGLFHEVGCQQVPPARALTYVVTWRDEIPPDELETSAAEGSTAAPVAFLPTEKSPAPSEEASDDLLFLWVQALAIVLAELLLLVLQRREDDPAIKVCITVVQACLLVVMYWVVIEMAKLWRKK